MNRKDAKGAKEERKRERLVSINNFRIHIFTRETKSAAFIRDALPKVQRCKICGGYLHAHSISIDHKTRKADGGLGTLDNAQLTHPYCNSTIKH